MYNKSLNCSQRKKEIDIFFQIFIEMVNQLTNYYTNVVYRICRTLGLAKLGFQQIFKRIFTTLFCDGVK